MLSIGTTPAATEHANTLLRRLKRERGIEMTAPCTQSLLRPR
jgi:hypothetical protein